MSGQSGTLAMLMRVEGPAPCPYPSTPLCRQPSRCTSNNYVKLHCCFALSSLLILLCFSLSLCLCFSLSLFAILLPFSQCNFMDFKFLHVS